MEINTYYAMCRVTCFFYAGDNRDSRVLKFFMLRYLVAKLSDIGNIPYI